MLTHILTNIPRRKGNQVMIFGQLIVCIMGNNFFLKNQTQNAIEIMFTDPFLKNQNLTYLSEHITGTSLPVSFSA